MAIQELSDGGPEGTRLGSSASEKVGFHGATPIAKSALTVLGALTVGETTPADIATALCELRDYLVLKGLCSNT